MRPQRLGFASKSAKHRAVQSVNFAVIMALSVGSFFVFKSWWGKVGGLAVYFAVLALSIAVIPRCFRLVGLDPWPSAEDHVASCDPRLALAPDPPEPE